MGKKYKDFYENIDRENVYSTCKRADDHGAYKPLTHFVDSFNLKKKKILEVGSSKGLFQDLVDDYVGLDVADTLACYYHKPYHVVRDDGTYPFDDNSFDGAWSWAVFEHIPDIDIALKELVRVIKPGGVILFAPAWQCRSWAAEGYPVRPYSDFGLKGKMIKVSIPIQNSILWRALILFPKRVLMHMRFLMGQSFNGLHHKKLKPNYEKFWMSDSDAVNNIDPHDAILWFESNGCYCISHPLHRFALFVRGGVLIFKKNVETNLL